MQRMQRAPLFVFFRQVFLLAGQAVFRRLSGAKSRKSNAEMQAKTPKMRCGDFRNTLWQQQDRDPPHAFSKSGLQAANCFSCSSVRW